MKIKVSDIPEEGMEIAAKASDDPWFKDVVRAAFQEDFPGEGPAILSLKVSKTCQNISLEGGVGVDLSPECDRCTETFKKHLFIPLSVHFAPSPAKESLAQESEEPAEADVNFAFYKGDEIDVGETVREALILEIPIQYFCTESCKGLCPRCGRNLNVKSCDCPQKTPDPRFAALKDLLKK